MERTADAARPNAGLSLGILLLAYIFNLIDRQIISVLAIPIKTDLGLSDTQLGLMGGLAFALFYTGVGVPIAWLADRHNRVKIIAISVGLWSAFTALCGVTQNFWQLFVARMGVGVGEAGGSAPCYALVADLFPAHQRTRALAVFSMGIPVGSALGILFGGWIASTLHWRAAFIIIGLAGLALAPLILWGVKEPDARRRAGKGTQGAAVSFVQALLILSKKPAFWLVAFAGACANSFGYGLIFWLPSFLVRTHGLNLMDVSIFFGTIILIGGTAGMLIGGWLGDKLGHRNRTANVYVPAISLLIAIPLNIGGLLSPTPMMAWFFFLLSMTMGLVWASPAMFVAQHLFAKTMRATASAAFLFVNNLFGIGLGTVILGLLSDGLNARYGAEALKYSILSALIFYVFSAALFALAAFRLKADWHDDAEDA